MALTLVVITAILLFTSGKEYFTGILLFNSNDLLDSVLAFC